MSRRSILDLPAEILNQILSICEQVSQKADAHCIAPLLTCQQLYHLTLRVLYRDLRFTYSSPPPSRTSCLHRSLESNPRLYSFVRSLVFDLRPENPGEYITLDDYVAAASVLSRCEAIHSLQIWGAAFLSPEDRKPFQMETLPGQPAIDLCRWELLQYALCQCHTLRKVEMASNRDSPGYGFKLRSDFQAQARDLRLLPGTGIKLPVPGTTTSENEQRKKGDPGLQGDARRRSIDFSISFGEGHAGKEYEARNIEFIHVFVWMKRRPQMLRRMVFGDFRSPTLIKEFRAAAYPNLHTVVCPPVHVRERRRGHSPYKPPSEVVDRLLGPSVHTFVFDLATYDQQLGLSSTAFGELEERWLRELAQSAAAPGRNSALQTIYIDFKPDPDCEQGFDPANYAWDRIVRLQRQLQPLGIQVKYTAPSMTREEYHELCRQHQEWIADEARQEE
ncbi:hypothetical protein ASPACDRAFT_1853164 [Aspergillus aculeatus ATCC 16872]|uniref:Uncharacterized protein n=1 Tax=Aspergillus aculeatus (strain ATCC 16872 / CBS 172.66 / WB 5094) TaxID=690307 RepID=A0A1L9X7G2_ASPA1|nr:uncharacterized protein ASPACDRAFT_1853164 [Aspergillus aculeatus ATCC 16872]OJK04268.1 hypothetical protein ASPACDRAFT_1853164 [Aspergillus aculeatus ATCC 16872]